MSRCWKRLYFPLARLRDDSHASDSINLLLETRQSTAAAGGLRADHARTAPVVAETTVAGSSEPVGSPAASRAVPNTWARDNNGGQQPRDIHIGNAAQWCWRAPPPPGTPAPQRLPAPTQDEPPPLRFGGAPERRLPPRPLETLHEDPSGALTACPTSWLPPPRPPVPNTAGSGRGDAGGWGKGGGRVGRAGSGAGCCVVSTCGMPSLLSFCLFGNTVRDLELARVLHDGDDAVDRRWSARRRAC